MTIFNPEKNSPQMFDLAKIQNGLSKKQMDKIQYECMLLRLDLQNDVHRVISIIPHLFTEDRTAANTDSIKEIEIKIDDKKEDLDKYYKSYHGINTYMSFE